MGTGHIELGLLGTGLDRSLAPALHELLGRLTGRDVVYVRHDRPPSFAPDVPAFLHELAARGVRGINVTHPFKELVAGLVTVDDPGERAVGAVNTVRFGAAGPRAWNTDWTGLVEVFRRRAGGAPAGVVAQLGAGGVGRAAAFALAASGATVLRLYDPDRGRAESLAAAVAAASPAPTPASIAAAAGGAAPPVTAPVVRVAASAAEAVEGADGVVNASPVGMHLHPGCPLEPAHLRGVRWVFDAVYSPVRTELLAHATTAGAEAVSGVELFFWQGVHAFERFHGTPLPASALAAARAVVDAEVARRSAAGA